MAWTCVTVGFVGFVLVHVSVPDIGKWLAFLPPAFAAIAWGVDHSRST
jgi:hypothetical protein